MFDLRFTRNLAATTVVVTLLSIGLAEVHHRPETAAKQQSFLRLERAMKIGLVVKAQQFR